MVKLNVALVGCGRMGAFTTERTRLLTPPNWLPLSHAEAIASNQNMELVAVCDNDPTRSAEAAQCYSAKAFTDAATMLEATKPDILSIATRTPGRVDLINLALDAGVRAIHSEKPLSQNLDLAEALMERVADSKTPFTYGTYRRFMPAYRTAKALLLDGEIGEITEVAIDHGANEPLLWSHPHSVDLLQFFVGREVEGVQANCDFFGIKASASLIDGDPKLRFARLAFQGGAQGLITSARGMHVRISGTRGCLSVLDNGQKLEVRTIKNPERPYIIDVRSVDVASGASGTARAFDELAAALISGAPMSITPEDISANLRLLWAIGYSAFQGGVLVSPAEIKKDMVITGRIGNLFA